MGEHSLLITDEDEHLRARKLLMPAFNGAALRGYGDLMAGSPPATPSAGRSAGRSRCTRG